MLIIASLLYCQKETWKICVKACIIYKRIFSSHSMSKLVRSNISKMSRGEQNWNTFHHDNKKMFCHNLWKENCTFWCSFILITRTNNFLNAIQKKSNNNHFILIDFLIRLLIIKGITLYLIHFGSWLFYSTDSRIKTFHPKHQTNYVLTSFYTTIHRWILFPSYTYNLFRGKWNFNTKLWYICCWNANNVISI